ncbi:TetR family transcriptional regulator [Albidovulum inexpectatum]|uniref:TetR family transcriptional regulator n=1 Tax=Albidovulum inexpectatum TaxID=196587 RepID=A0A2S5JMY5_9RHOB|nr:TetR/AcrR family transcriptional regulator [Albidovulum inexpectatum]PPB82605.1 TetR family transcriptional regulator [Albidovulum inexpectatum]
MARAASYDRDAALEAAMTLFWRKGYHATSLKDLEAALKMKPGSIYAAFDSKENLYLLALERYFQRSRDAFRTALARAESPLGALAAHLRAYADLPPEDAARQACMLTRTLVDTRATDPAIAQATQAYLDEMAAEFTRAFQAARDRGEIAPDSDPARLARRFQAYVTALRVELHRGAPDRVIRDLAEDMAREIEALRV